MQTTRALGPGAGLGWLKRAIHLGRRNPRAIFGAVALVAAVAILPSLLQALLQGGLKLDANSAVMVVGALAPLMMALMALLIGGMLRVIDAAEHDRPTHAFAVFDCFRPENGAARLAGLGLLLGVAYLIAFYAVIALFGGDLAPWYQRMLSASLQEDPAALQAALQAVPDGLGTVMALGTLVGLFFGGLYAIAIGQAALGGRGILAALRDGVAGTLKNLLPILAAAAIVFVLMIPFLLAVSLLMLLLGALGALVHPALSTLLMLPVNLGMLLVLYVVLFGVMYAMWRDICAHDDDGPRNVDPPGTVTL